MTERKRKRKKERAREGEGVNSVRMFEIENFDVKTSDTNILLIEKKKKFLLRESERVSEWAGTRASGWYT